MSVHCENVTILPDDIVETEEVFIVALTSEDTAVLFNQSVASVVIVDSDRSMLYVRM